jgi:hypothetical protein
VGVAYVSVVKPKRIEGMRAKATPKEHPLEWLTEGVAMEPTFVFKAWFGGRLIMLRGKHQLFLTTQGKPWQGWQRGHAANSWVGR